MMTTKICSVCGADRLVHLISLDKKICPDCKTEHEWTLSPGQKPLFENSKPAK